MSIQRITILFAFIVSLKSGTLFAQEQKTTSNTEQKQIELLEFILLNLDSIQSYYNGLANLIIEIKIDDYSSILKEANFYSQFDSIQTTTINAWPMLKEKILQLYFFNPSFVNPELSSLSYTRISVPLNKRELKKYIKYTQSEKLSYAGVLVKPNSNYQLKLDEFEYYPAFKDSTSIHLTNFTVCSKLEGLNSEVIKIHENYYLFFKVISTSNNGYLESKIILSIYYILNGKSYFLDEFELTDAGKNEFYNSSSGKSSINHGEVKIVFKLKCTVTFD